MGKFCLIICAVAMASSASTRILGKRAKVNGLDIDSAKGGESRNNVSDMFCCCREGHCLGNEIDEGSHAKWKGNMSLCCRFADHLCSASFPNEYCESPQEIEIEKIIDEATGTCRRQLRAFVEQIKLQLDLHKEKFFHGTAIKAIHMSKAVTDIVYRLLVPGQDKFDPSSIGAHFYRHNKRVTLLWNEINKDDRICWKSILNAAELSRGDDVPFARVVDHVDVGQLRACSNLDHLWYVSSATFASVAPKKPLVLLIGKDNEEQLKKTQFMKGELQGVVENPPRNGLEVISLGKFACKDLMPVLDNAIVKLIPHGTKGEDTKRKWLATSSYTCREADVKDPNNLVGYTYPVPKKDSSIREKLSEVELVKWEEHEHISNFATQRLDLFFRNPTIENLRATLAAIRVLLSRRPRVELTNILAATMYGVTAGYVAGQTIANMFLSPLRKQKMILRETQGKSACERIVQTTLPKETGEGELISLFDFCKQYISGTTQKALLTHLRVGNK